MRGVWVGLLAICLAGCNAPEAPCWVAQSVRLDVQGREFTLPVSLRPNVHGAPDGNRLPSYKHRAPDGGWAYCQRPDDPPVVVEDVSFYPRQPEMDDVSFLIIGQAHHLRRPGASRYPVTMEAGFEVTRTRGPAWVFSPAGGVSQTPVLASCMQDENDHLRNCRVSFVTQRGVSVTFDLRGAHPLSKWGDAVSKVDRYVTGFETMAVR